MKTYYFPHNVGKVVKAISFIMALILETIYLVLLPVKYMRFKAHLLTAFLATVGGFYMHFAIGIEHAALYVTAAFAGFALAVAFVKIIGKGVAKAEKFFLRIYDCRIGTYVTYRCLQHR